MSAGDAMTPAPQSAVAAGTFCPSTATPSASNAGDANIGNTGEDEVVVWYVASAQMNDALAGVDARCFIKEDLDFLLTTEDGTQRAEDFISREQPRRNLVEHRAEEVIIPLIDQRHANWSATQSASRGEASEAATDNDHPGSVNRHLPGRDDFHKQRNTNN
jgi:hypothetical protein